jgi:membrane-bound serine protease (ClpP class)
MWPDRGARARRPSSSLLVAALVAIVAGVLGVIAGPVAAQEADVADEVVSQVEVLPVRGFLDPPVASAMRGLIADAESDGAELVVLQVDGPGGISADVEALVAAIESASVPVAVFVSPQQGLTAQAGGAYGLAWAAADIRAVSESALLGPIAPANLSDEPGDLPEQQTLDRLLGRPAPPELLDTVWTAAELEAQGLVDVVAPNVAALLAELDGVEVATARGPVTLALPRDGVEVRLHSLGLVGRMLHAAAAPAFIYLLLAVGLVLLLFELFQPGFGVAGFAGLVMLPFALFGLGVLPVTWWALALLVVGLALFSLDTAVAGLGPVTAAATAAFGVGSWFLFGSGPLRVPPLIAVLTTVAALGFFVVVLTIVLRAQAGPEGVDLADLVGRPGIVRSVLNPEGHVYIDDALWRARTAGGERMRVGTAVAVTEVDGAVLVVAPFDASAQGSGVRGGSAGAN